MPDFTTNRMLFVCEEKGYRYDPDTGGIYSPQGVKLKLSLRGKGAPRYLHFGVKDPHTNVTRGVPVHRFAAFKLYGIALFFAEGVRHKDGVSTNNKATNILLGTQQQNMRDIPANQRIKQAELAASYQRKMNYKIAAAIREERTAGASVTELAKKYKVTRGTLYALLKGETYKHPEPDQATLKGEK